MSGAATDDPGGFEQELRAISTMIRDAGDKLIAGELIDMSALDGRVTGLCTRLEADPAAAPAGFGMQVQNMIDEMTLLARMIEARLLGLRGNLQQGTGQSGGQTGGRSGALSAYRKTPSPDEPKR